MDISDRIKELIAEQGVSFHEKAKTIYTTCPKCDRSDKFSILKANGSCICYHGSCDFGQRWFHDWLSMIAKIPVKEAKDKMYGMDSVKVNPDAEVKIDLDESYNKRDPWQGLVPIKFPEDHMIRIESPYADEAQEYLRGRGIPIGMAAKYGIKYTPMFRRIIFPVTMNGLVYGYQGRAIDKVSDAEKMRNNDGFNRAKMVMFVDGLKTSEHVIFCEGPVDAIKFDKVGGAIATMGKVISDQQKQLIFKNPLKKIYIALDDDAAEEMNQLAAAQGLPMFKIEVPNSCRERCELNNKKADFGECTFDECVEAFREAKPIDAIHTFVHWQE